MSRSTSSVAASISYDVHNQMSIKTLTLKGLLSFSRTKQNLNPLLSLALLGVTANSSKKFVVSVHDVTKVNRPHSLDDEMLTHGHEEADTLISFQIIDTIRYDTFKEVHVRCSDTDVFSFSMDLDANGYLGTLNKLIMPAGVGAKYREIDIRERVNAVGKTKSATVVRLLEIPDGDWRRKFVRVSTKSWTESFMALSADDPIIESLTSLG